MVGRARPRPVIMNNRMEEGGDVWLGTTNDAESAKCRVFRSSDTNRNHAMLDLLDLTLDVRRVMCLVSKITRSL